MIKVVVPAIPLGGVLKTSFQEMISETELIDAGFQGPTYTWKRGNSLKRLDRVLINLAWRIRFQNALVLHLPFFKYDHRAILIKNDAQEGS